MVRTSSDSVALEVLVSMHHVEVTAKLTDAPGVASGG